MLGSNEILERVICREPEHRQELLDGIAAKDKTFNLYEGLRHEVYNELPGDRVKVLSDLHTICTHMAR